MPLYVTIDNAVSPGVLKLFCIATLKNHFQNIATLQLVNSSLLLPDVFCSLFCYYSLQSYFLMLTKCLSIVLIWKKSVKIQKTFFNSQISVLHKHLIFSFSFLRTRSRILFYPSQKLGREICSQKLCPKKLLRKLVPEN